MLCSAIPTLPTNEEMQLTWHSALRSSLGSIPAAGSGVQVPVAAETVAADALESVVGLDGRIAPSDPEAERAAETSLWQLHEARGETDDAMAARERWLAWNASDPMQRDR